MDEKSPQIKIDFLWWKKKMKRIKTKKKKYLIKSFPCKQKLSRYQFQWWRDLRLLPHRQTISHISSVKCSKLNSSICSGNGRRYQLRIELCGECQMRNLNQCQTHSKNKKTHKSLKHISFSYLCIHSNCSQFIRSTTRTKTLSCHIDFIHLNARQI